MSCNSTGQTPCPLSRALPSPIELIGALLLCLIVMFTSVQPSFAADPCDACKKIEKQLNDAQTALDKLKGKEAKVAKDLKANLKSQRESLEAEQEATRNFNQQIGTGASSHDPSTGITIDSRAQPDGTVTITTTYPDGRTESRPRDSRYMKKLEKEIKKQQADRAKLKKAENKLKGEQKDLQAKIKAKEGEVLALQNALANCLKNCAKQALLIDPASNLAFLVLPGTDPQDVIDDYELEGAQVTSIPEAAGGGSLVSVPDPGEDTVNKLGEDERCEHVGQDFCREFLPGTEAVPHDKQPLQLAQADTGTSLQGTTKQSDGTPVEGTTVTVMPVDPEVGSIDPGWQIEDSMSPSMGVTGSEGYYDIELSENLGDSYQVVAGSGWTTVTSTGGGSQSGGGTTTGTGTDTGSTPGTGPGTDTGSSSSSGTRTRPGSGGGTIAGGPDDDGDDPRDTPPPVIYGEEIDADPRVGILLRHDDWRWIPEMNAVTFTTAKIYVPDPSRKGIWIPSDSEERVITVKFVRRSTEPGQAMNQDLKFAPEDSPDIYLQSNGSLRCSDDPSGGKGYYGTCETISPYNEKLFSERALDYGSYSAMEATCPDCVGLKPIYPYSFIGGYRPAVDSWPDAVEDPVREHRLVRVPHDENLNNIADQYELDKLRAGIPATEDDEKTPWGNGVRGDGYSAYQEYRGFQNKDVRHQRSKWGKKTLLVDNSTGMSLSQFRTQSGLEVIEIFPGSHKNRVANYNKNFAHVVDQHCLIFKYDNAGEGVAGRSYGFGPPKNVEKVILDWSYSSDSNSTVAHELGHATGIRHHGDKSSPHGKIEVHPQSNILSGLAHTYTHGGTHLCGTFLPAKFKSGAKGDQASGFENCIMRYNYTRDVYIQANDDFHCHQKGRARLSFCDTSSGTGQNARGRTSGDATVGDCKGQIIVNDNS